jgi:hypothetical protein
VILDRGPTNWAAAVKEEQSSARGERRPVDFVGPMVDHRPKKLMDMAIDGWHMA